jgi:glycerol-3-phosphate dehydrogenase
MNPSRDAPATDSYDIAIIGGGIHGVGVAQAAAAAGYAAVVLEQTALAAGTSSRSSKLIHGGLRYLESGQIHLVRESLHERNTLLRVAPDLVRATRFYIPIYKDTARRPWLIRLGLSLYAILAGFHHHSLFRRLHKAQWTELDGLRTQGLQTVFRYWDAQTDDARLTQAVMQSALSLGASLLCPAGFTGAVYANDRYRVNYERDGETASLSCCALVNAAGPWANEVLGRISPATSTRAIDLVQGAHIVIEGETRQGVYYLEAPADRRAVFVMPWYGNTMIGTTETLHRGDPAKVEVLDEEVDYLLATFRHYFPHRRANIIDRFAGLRVLPHASGAAFNRPRDTVLHSDAQSPGLVTIYGGKLTGYRATAEKLIRELEPRLGRRRRIADTRKLMLG